ncbi:MAG: M15 family metallopeptidase, partial [Firmicutes bacterium]|nr:M15 family metallopeptidase [Bacillota bacterium]
GIKIDSAWEDARMINVVTPAGDKWKVHRKAASYYEDAINYLDCTFIRVRGEADSGVIRLWDLVSTFDGTLNIRFVYGRRFVSHHAFGTAIDLNSSMDPNWTDLSNRELILTEVRDHLSYNGIKTADNGTEYYDFTYDGNQETDGNNVPMTVVNYLLYELAFYRAGFHWGFYYDHTCDAMHFGLSEMPASIHDTSSRSLRKVYTYID